MSSLGLKWLDGCHLPGVAWLFSGMQSLWSSNYLCLTPSGGPERRQSSENLVALQDPLRSGVSVGRERKSQEGGRETVGRGGQEERGGRVSRKEAKGEMGPSERAIGADTISRDKNTNCHQTQACLSLGKGTCGSYCWGSSSPAQDRSLLLPQCLLQGLAHKGDELHFFEFESKDSILSVCAP